MTRLDGLRAVAALMVLTLHFLVDLDASFKFPFGEKGVPIFFVISGFLITSILLKQKTISGFSKNQLIYKFVIKRALRLFPIYYLFLGGLFLLHKYGGLWICEGNNEWYYFFYLQNVLFYDIGFQSTLLNHTWSLAVEEQFYLLWPWLIFYIPSKYESKMLVSIFLIGIFSRACLELYYSGNGTIKGVTFMHFDTLGIGSLLAYWIYYDYSSVIKIFNKYGQIFFWISLLFSFYFATYNVNIPFVSNLFLIIMSVTVVFLCSNNNRFVLSKIFEYKYLVYLGKISYGIYLYHKVVPFFMQFTSDKFGYNLPNNNVLLFIIYTLITLVISILSYELLEKHLLKLKKLFDVK
jgi:peptidoglycan/LPS O-acetylase OafA/YrhL